MKNDNQKMTEQEWEAFNKVERMIDNIENLMYHEFYNRWTHSTNVNNDNWINSPEYEEYRFYNDQLKKL